MTHSAFEMTDRIEPRRENKRRIEQMKYDSRPRATPILSTRRFLSFTEKGLSRLEGHILVICPAGERHPR